MAERCSARQARRPIVRRIGSRKRPRFRASMRLRCDYLFEDVRDLKHCAILYSFRSGAESAESLRLEEFLYSSSHSAEIAQHDTDFVFANPVGVVALLRQGPGVALHDY